ncbi:gag protein, partial [Aphelenchoides avenae]
MVNTPVPSDNSEAGSAVADDRTEEQIRELREEAEEEANAFKTSMKDKLKRLDELMAEDFNVQIQAGNPDLDEFRRLTRIRTQLIDCRSATVRLNDVLQQQMRDFDAYRRTLPAAVPRLRSIANRCYNQCHADFQLDDKEVQARVHADKMSERLQSCEDNLEALRALGIDEGMVNPPPPVADGDRVAEAAPNPPPEAAAIDETPEEVRADAEASSTKKKDPASHAVPPAADEFGDTTPRHSEARVHEKAGGYPPTSRSTGSESIFGPFRSDAATSSSSPDPASTPLAFTALGKHLLPTKDTGPDFSLYGSNPFYVNSSVKLPIPVDYTFSSTKEPLISQTHLPMLSPETFDGNLLLYPRFRDAFIRLVHAPGRHMSDAERLRYLVGSLKGPALSVVASYTTSHGDGQYHHVTAALETRYYQPFQACRVLHKMFLELRPKNTTAVELNRFADETIAHVRLLRDYNDDLASEKIAVETWMEKIPHTVRLEMCRYLEPSSHLSLEAAVRALQKYTSWQMNASLFADTCGLGPQFKSVTNGLKAILAPSHSSGPTIVEVKDDQQASGFFGNPRNTLDRPKALCALCAAKGHHWPVRCNVFKTPAERLRRAQELKYCLLCLRSGHSLGNKDCRATVETCPHCLDAVHHRALCQAYLDRYCQGTLPTYGQPDRRTSTRQQGGFPPSQPETGWCDPKRAKKGKASGHRGKGPGAGPKYDGDITAKPKSAKPAASTEEPADGLEKPSTTSTHVPDTSSVQRHAEHESSRNEMHPAVNADGSRHVA